ncbi:hypothetical protein IFR05_004378, partial [Cadophora sp. M221]
MYTRNSNLNSLTPWLRLAQKAIPHYFNITLVIGIVELQIETADYHGERYVDFGVRESAEWKE